MLHQLIHVVNFDDSGVFLAPASESPSTGNIHEDTQQQQHHHHHSLESSLGSHSSSSGGASSSASSGSSTTVAPDTAPSFESFLAMPRDFMAAHALHSSTEATLLLDVAGLAIEMDAIAECAMEQLHDRREVTRLLMAAQSQEPHGGASLMTTVLVLLRQASDFNTHTLTALLQKLQVCLDRLSQLRYPLAQCIESNTVSAHELLTYDPSLAQSRRILAQAEDGLLQRLADLLDPEPDFYMTPLTVPRWKPHPTTAQVCWPGSASSPYRGLDLSGSCSSSSSIVSLSSSSTQTTSLPPTTPIRDRNASLRDHTAGDGSSSHSHSHSQSSDGSSKQHNQQQQHQDPHQQQHGSHGSSGSSSSGRQHSQPRL